MSACLILGKRRRTWCNFRCAVPCCQTHDRTCLAEACAPNLHTINSANGKTHLKIQDILKELSRPRCAFCLGWHSKSCDSSGNQLRHQLHHDKNHHHHYCSAYATRTSPFKHYRSSLGDGVGVAGHRFLLSHLLCAASLFRVLQMRFQGLLCIMYVSCKREVVKRPKANGKCPFR